MTPHVDRSCFFIPQHDLRVGLACDGLQAPERWIRGYCLSVHASETHAFMQYGVMRGPSPLRRTGNAATRGASPPPLAATTDGSPLSPLVLPSLLPIVAVRAFRANHQSFWSSSSQPLRISAFPDCFVPLPLPPLSPEFGRALTPVVGLSQQWRYSFKSTPDPELRSHALSWNCAHACMVL